MVNPDHMGYGANARVGACAGTTFLHQAEGAARMQLKDPKRRQLLGEARSVDEVHRFLVNGMADAAFGESAIVRNSLRSRAAQDQFEVGEPVRKWGAWLAGSLDFGDTDAALFQKAMKEMTADGTAPRTLKSYDLAG
jgi:polar amino acid transport system substrate-binding protein